MPLSDEAQALFDHCKQALPRWLTGGVKATLEWLYGFTDIFDSARQQGQAWLDLTYLDTATGTDLDQHAIDRGTTRRASESDATLRERLRQITDVVTEPAIKARINAILAASSLGTCTIITLRRDRAHSHAQSHCSAFLSRGFRMTNATRPMGYVVILPFGTTAAIGAAVSEYLRQFGPAGYNYLVEVRGIP